MARPCTTDRPLVSALTTCARLSPSETIYQAARSRMVDLLRLAPTTDALADLLGCSPRTARRLVAAYDLQLHSRRVA